MCTLHSSSLIESCEALLLLCQGPREKVEPTLSGAQKQGLPCLRAIGAAARAAAGLVATMVCEKIKSKELRHGLRTGHGQDGESIS